MPHKHIHSVVFTKKRTTKTNAMYKHNKAHNDKKNKDTYTKKKKQERWDV